MAKANKRNYEDAIADYSAAIRMPNIPADVKAMALYNRALAYSAIHQDARAADDLAAVLEMPGLPATVRRTPNNGGNGYSSVKAGDEAAALGILTGRKVPVVSTAPISAGRRGAWPNLAAFGRLFHGPARPRPSPLLRFFGRFALVLARRRLRQIVAPTAGERTRRAAQSVEWLRSLR